jgi:hypothetical protein
MNNGYYFPWLWADGKSCNWIPYGWRDSVVRHMADTSVVQLAHVGTTYDPLTRSGEVRVECYNNSADPITAALQIAITEDSIYYPSPNGDTWHNHVFRDYVPGIYGTPLTIPAGGYDTAFQAFTIDTSWVEARCKLVVWLQNMTVQPDSTMPCYQGLQTRLLDFTAVAEPGMPQSSRFTVRVSPNPCRTGCRFTLSGAGASGARIALYAPDGRLVSVLSAPSSLLPTPYSLSWSRSGLPRGIYLYRVNAGTATAEGKLVVTD